MINEHLGKFNTDAKEAWLKEYVRCLSIWQPWASLVACNFKKFETRPWDTQFRGVVIIHAAQTNSGKQREYFTRQVFNMALTAAGYHRFDDLPLGAALGLGIIRNVMPCKVAMEREGYVHPSQIHFGVWNDEQFAWEIEHIQRFEKPIEMKGKQGLFLVPDEQMAALKAAIDWELIEKLGV